MLYQNPRIMDKGKIKKLSPNNFEQKKILNPHFLVFQTLGIKRVQFTT